MPKTPKPEPTEDHDPGWKNVIGRFFSSFMDFYFPTIFKIIDWDKQWTFLDKELEKIRKNQKIGKKNADKLVRVFLKSGEEAWLLIHIEVQMSYQAGFKKRVFVYNYRIYDQHDIEVISLVVLGDDRPKWRPKNFSYGHGGAQTRIDFLTAKLSDYEDRWEELEASDNPFALVTMVHLKAMQTRKDPESRYAWKFRLMRLLVTKGWKRNEIADLIDFMDYIMILPEELDKKLVMELNKKEGGNKMTYISLGRRVGRQEAREETHEEAHEAGCEETLQKVLRELISEKFGQVPDWVSEKLVQADNPTLFGWVRALIKTNNLKDLFA